MDAVPSFLSNSKTWVSMTEKKKKKKENIHQLEQSQCPTICPSTLTNCVHLETNLGLKLPFLSS